MTRRSTGKPKRNPVAKAVRTSAALRPRITRNRTKYRRKGRRSEQLED